MEITFSNVQKKYTNKSRSKVALNSINLTLTSGLTFIIGESGSGKTSLVNLLSLQDEATAGSIWIDGININTYSRQQKQKVLNSQIGLVYQDINLIDDLTIMDNILLPLKLQNKTIDNQKINDILKKLNLEADILNDHPINLSGGQKQRVAIARTMVKDASIIIADEPTGAVDHKNAISIMEIFKELAQNCLIVVVSHNLELANRYADRIIELENGNIVSDNIIANFESNILKENITSTSNNSPKLPLSYTLKFALINIKKKFLRLFFAVITLFLTVAMLLATRSIINYHDLPNIELAIKESQINYGTLLRTRPSDGLFNFSFSQSEADNFANLIGADSIIPVNNSIASIGESLSINISDNISDNISEIGSAIYGGFYSATAEQFEALNIDYVGSVPSGEHNQIMLTSVICYALGWVSRADANNRAVLTEIINTKKYTLYSYWWNWPNSRTDFEISGIIINSLDFLDQDESSGEYSDFRNSQIFSDVGFSPFKFNQIWIDSANPEPAPLTYNKIYVSLAERNYTKISNYNDRLSEHENGSYKVLWKYSNSFDGVEDFKTVYIQITLILAGFFLILSIITFLGFVYNSISLLLPKIKILRSLGASMLDCQKIFIIQNIIFSVIIMTLTFITQKIIYYNINKFMSMNLNFIFKWLKINFLDGLIALMLLILVASLISYLLLFRNYKKKQIFS